MIDRLKIPTPAGIFDGLAGGPEPGRPVLLHGFPECAEQGSTNSRRSRPPGIVRWPSISAAIHPASGLLASRATDPNELIGDVLAVADALGCTRFDLVGHDWGSAVAWVTPQPIPTACLA